MDLASLTLLVDIIDAGNLSQAARNLKMTRANVSYHLKQLEKFSMIGISCTSPSARAGMLSKFFFALLTFDQS